MTTQLKIDFVSDIACPRCAVGLGALEQALHTLQTEVQADIHFQPFELNPQMPAGGQDLFEHLNQKYGSSAEQQAQMYQNIKARGEEWASRFTPLGVVEFSIPSMRIACCTGPRWKAPRETNCV